MSNWTEDEPGAGDTGAVSSFAAGLTADGESASGIVSALNGALTGVGSSWTGSGADAWARTVDELKTDLTGVQQAVDSVAGAARSYASTVDDIQRLAAIQTGRLADARTIANRTYLDDAQSPPSEQVIRQRAQDHAGALDDAAAANRALSDLADQRRAADSAFVAALGKAVPATWPSERAAFAAVGITHPERLSASDIDKRVDHWMHGLAKSGRTFTKGDATALLAFGERGDITPAQVATLLREHGGLAAQLPHVDATLVASWWKSMDDPDVLVTATGHHPTAQVDLVEAIPRILGNLNGVAYWARDSANQAVLVDDLAATKKQIAAMTKEGPPMPPLLSTPEVAQFLQQQYFDRLAKLQSRMDGLSNILVSVTPKNSTAAPRELISLVEGYPPLAAVSVGDLDQARDVTYMVPGMNTATPQMKGWADGAQNLFTTQSTYTHSKNQAVVAWIGYKTPPLPTGGLGVFHGDSAREGAAALANDLSGLNATRAGSTMTLNVVAHSYGTTTASLALAQHDLHVDSFVSAASAGIEKSIPNAAAIHANRVFAEQGQNVIPWMEAGKGDEWAASGRVISGRENPMDPSFGATRMNADGAPGLKGVTAHDPVLHWNKTQGYGYFDMHTESIDNVALATTGRGDEVSPYKAAPLTPLEQGILNDLEHQGMP